MYATMQDAQDPEIPSSYFPHDFSPVTSSFASRTAEKALGLYSQAQERLEINTKLKEEEGGPQESKMDTNKKTYAQAASAQNGNTQNVGIAFHGAVGDLKEFQLALHKLFHKVRDAGLDVPGSVFFQAVRELLPSDESLVANDPTWFKLSLTLDDAPAYQAWLQQRVKSQTSKPEGIDPENMQLVCTPCKGTNDVPEEDELVEAYQLATIHPSKRETLTADDAKGPESDKISNAQEHTGKAGEATELGAIVPQRPRLRHPEPRPSSDWRASYRAAFHAKRGPLALAYIRAPEGLVRRQGEPSSAWTERPTGYRPTSARGHRVSTSVDSRAEATDLTPELRPRATTIACGSPTRQEKSSGILSPRSVSTPNPEAYVHGPKTPRLKKEELDPQGEVIRREQKRLRERGWGAPNPRQGEFVAALKTATPWVKW